VDQVIDLLVASSQPHRHPAVRWNANRLLEKMAKGEWWIAAGPHVGGDGKDKDSDDWTMHITIKTKRNGGYHLKQDARGHLFEITGPGMQPIQPWSAPGSPPGEKGRRGRS
jgi:hypothetical protein